MIQQIEIDYAEQLFNDGCENMREIILENLKIKQNIVNIDDEKHT